MHRIASRYVITVLSTVSFRVENWCFETPTFCGMILLCMYTLVSVRQHHVELAQIVLDDKSQWYSAESLISHRNSLRGLPRGAVSCGDGNVYANG